MKYLIMAGLCVMAMLWTLFLFALLRTRSGVPKSSASAKNHPSIDHDSESAINS